MARANLIVDTEIKNSFLIAQESTSIRILKISIQGEKLVLDSVINSLDDAQADFEEILPTVLQDDIAHLVLFRLVDEIKSSNSWLLVAWIPDNCRVRDKMLYSSSREDLKKNLGVGYFQSEYSASLPSDFIWNHLQSYMAKDHAKVLTDSEILLKEEKVIIIVLYALFIFSFGIRLKFIVKVIN